MDNFYSAPLGFHLQKRYNADEHEAAELLDGEQSELEEIDLQYNLSEGQHEMGLELPERRTDASVMVSSGYGLKRPDDLCVDF